MNRCREITQFCSITQSSLSTSLAFPHFHRLSAKCLSSKQQQLYLFLIRHCAACFHSISLEKLLLLLTSQHGNFIHLWLPAMFSLKIKLVMLKFRKGMSAFQNGKPPHVVLVQPHPKGSSRLIIKQKQFVLAATDYKYDSLTSQPITIAWGSQINRAK